MRELICLIGPSGAGKSTAAKIISEKYGYEYITSSNYVNQIKSQIHNSLDYEYDSNELIASISLLYSEGFNGFMKEIFENLNSNKIVWDSCININCLEVVLRQFDKVYFLAMTAPFKERIMRVSSRECYIDYDLYEISRRIEKVDKYERSLGLGDLMLISDWTIVANDIQDLENKLAIFCSQCKPTDINNKVSMIDNRFVFPKKEEINMSPLLEYVSLQGGSLIGN